MEEFGFQDDLFEEKKKVVSNPDDLVYVARIEEPLKEDRVIKYQLDNLYLDKQYHSAIEFALSHFHPPLTTESILQGRKKKKKKCGGEKENGEGGGVWGRVGRRLAEVYDILIWCYFRLGDWKMIEQILLAMLLIHNCQVGSITANFFVYWRLLGKAQSELGKYEECSAVPHNSKLILPYTLEHQTQCELHRRMDGFLHQLLARAELPPCVAPTRWLAQKSVLSRMGCARLAYHCAGCRGGVGG